MHDLSLSLALVRPELALACGLMVLLVLGVFRGDQSARGISWGVFALMLLAGALVLIAPSEEARPFGGALVIDGFAVYAKVLVLIGSAAAVAISMEFLRLERLERFEYPILMGLATLGMMLMISANDFMSLYVALELQSLALYVLAAFNRDSLRASEAGLKYFVLGALSSGLLLYGISLVYGTTGTTGFDGIATVLSTTEVSAGTLVGLAFIVAGLAFKVSAVPFHMWTPDVYEGAPTPVTAFFAAAPKVAAMALFVRTMFGPFGAITAEWTQIIILLAILSMALGAFAAIGQTNIKRLMAYSGIGHVGYALVGLAAGTPEGVRGVLIYMTIYLATNLGVFVCILSMRRKEGIVERIEDLSGLSRTQPVLAFTLAILMFSLAGIPPLAGFFGKFFVFLAATKAGLVWLAVVALVLSVVGSYYYLRIVKVMYFDEPAPAFVQQMPGEMKTVLALSGVFTLFFVLIAGPLIVQSGIAARALFGG